MESILNTLLEQGMTVALMTAMLWILIKKLLNQYEGRIEVLEKANSELRNKLDDLNDKIVELHKEHIESLKQISKA